MGKPTIGELDTDVDKAQTEIPKKLTVLEETSQETIYNLIFSDIANRDKVQNKK